LGMRRRKKPCRLSRMGERQPRPSHVAPEPPPGMGACSPTGDGGRHGGAGVVAGVEAGVGAGVGESGGCMVPHLGVGGRVGWR
jgi:hypothetical protein